MPKISQLAALTTPDSGDELPIVDVSTSTTKKITRTNLLKGAPLPADTVDTQAIDDGAVTPDKLSTGAASAVVATSQGTSSTSFTDLSTVGPAVTVDIGDNGLALVTMYAQMTQSNNTGSALFTVALSGANTVAADSSIQVRYQAFANNAISHGGNTVLLTGLTPGSTTFTMKYAAATTGTATFANRKISVVPL